MREAWASAPGPWDGRMRADALRARRGWDWPSLFAGAAAGAATLPFVGVLHGMLGVALSGPHALALVPFFGLVATGVGLPVVVLVGVPVAALAWTLLRRIRAEWIHVVAFGALGGLLMLVPAVGTALVTTSAMTALAWSGGFGWQAFVWTIEELARQLPYVAYGVVAATVARIVAGLVVGRTLRAQAQWDALAAYSDVAARWRA